MENEISIKNVMDIWKDSYSSSVKKFSPYNVSQQLKQIAALFSPGLSYYYVMNFHNLEIVYVSEGVKDVTGFSSEETTIEKILSQIPPDELPVLKQKELATSDFLTKLSDPNDVLRYKIMYTYQIKDLHGNFRTILLQNTVLSMSEEGGVENVLGIHTDITHLSLINNNNGISFINFEGGRSYFNIDASRGIFDPRLADNQEKDSALTKRELEIATYLAKGFNAQKIADILNVSSHTVRTHRKNMLKKLNCSNSTELVVQCLAAGAVGG